MIGCFHCVNSPQEDEEDKGEDARPRPKGEEDEEGEKCVYPLSFGLVNMDVGRPNKIKITLTIPHEKKREGNGIDGGDYNSSKWSTP